MFVLEWGFINGEDEVTHFPCTTVPHVQILCHNQKYLTSLISQAFSLRCLSFFVTVFHFTHIEQPVEFNYTNISWPCLVNGIHTIFQGTVNYFFKRRKQNVFSHKEKAVYWERKTCWHFDYNVIFQINF